MPLRPRHTYAAGFQCGLPIGDINRPKEFPVPVDTGARRCPAHIRQVGAGGLLLRGVQALVPRVHRPVLLAGPEPSDGANPFRRCRGCFDPIGASPPIRLPPASPSRCDGLAAVLFHHRTV